MADDIEVSYGIPESVYKEVMQRLNEALDTKVSYNNDKIKMAEDCIQLMRSRITLAKNAMGRILGDCCRPK